jgi:hypothetical protein
MKIFKFICILKIIPIITNKYNNRKLFINVELNLRYLLAKR